MKKFDNYRKNLDVLRRSDQQDLNNEFIISGIIDKFSIQFELGWKVLKELLTYEGINAAKTGSPREIIKQAYQYYPCIEEDVVLDFFKGKKELLLKLRSGMALSLIDCYLLAKLNGKTVRIAKLSKACKDRIESLLSKGYCPVSAEIRFIVAWKKEGDADETPVVLPDIHFQKELSIK